MEIMFTMFQNDMPYNFKLPAKIEQVREYFLKRQGKKRLSAGQIEQIKLQAERTAWKILSDLVEIRISYILIESAEFIEMFLPDAWNGKTTYYEKLKSGGFKQLTSGSQND